MKNEEMKKLKEEEVKILDYFVEICKENNLTYHLSYGTLLGAVRHKGFIPWDDDIDVSMPPEDYKRFLEIFKSDENYFLQNVKTEKYIHTVFTKIRKNNTCMVEKDWQYIKIHKGINIDIFPLLPYPDDARERKKFLFKFRMATLLVSKNNKVSSFKNKIVFTILKLIPRKITNKIVINIMDSLLNYDGKYSQYKIELNDEPFNVEWFKKTKKVEFENKMYDAPFKYDEILKKMYGNYMQLPKESERIGHGEIILSFDKDYDSIVR